MAKQFIDPICGMTVMPENAAGNLEYNGETIYFCSKGCLAKFKQQIEKPQSQVVQLGRKQTSEKDFETHTDPVCKMLVKPETTAATYEYKDKKILFLCGRL